MLVLILTALVATYLATVVLGHALLIAAVARCLHERLASVRPASLGEPLALRVRLSHAR